MEAYSVAAAAALAVAEERIAFVAEEVDDESGTGKATAVVVAAAGFGWAATGNPAAGYHGAAALKARYEGHRSKVRTDILVDWARPHTIQKTTVDSVLGLPDQA